MIKNLYMVSGLSYLLFWFLVTFITGMLIHFPLLFSAGWINQWVDIGSIRAVHTTVSIYGFLVNGVILILNGSVVKARVLKKKADKNKDNQEVIFNIANLTVFIYNVVIGLAAILGLFGLNEGYQYSPAPWIVDYLITFLLSLFVLYLIRMFFSRVFTTEDPGHYLLVFFSFVLFVFLHMLYNQGEIYDLFIKGAGADPVWKDFKSIWFINYIEIIVIISGYTWFREKKLNKPVLSKKDQSKDKISPFLTESGWVVFFLLWGFNLLRQLRYPDVIMMPERAVIVGYVSYHIYSIIFFTYLFKTTTTSGLSDDRFGLLKMQLKRIALMFLSVYFLIKGTALTPFFIRVYPFSGWGTINLHLLLLGFLVPGIFYYLIYHDRVPGLRVNSGVRILKLYYYAVIVYITVSWLETVLRGAFWKRMEWFGMLFDPSWESIEGRLLFMKIFSAIIWPGFFIAASRIYFKSKQSQPE